MEAKETFSSGAQRDSQLDKPRYDLIPPEPMRRLAALYASGAQHYGDYNWAKGMPLTRILASLMRHLYAAIAGNTDEDHWAAVLWNTMAIMHFQNTKWNDLYDWAPKEPK
jgi:hypothetical protein